MSREPIEWLEIDVDQCTLEYGVGDCPAVLGTDSDNKCFNTFATCPRNARSAFDLGTITYTYCKPQSKLPTKVGVFPVLNSVSARSGMVNIAGSDDSMNSLGKRETMTFILDDFPYHDRYTDKYALERVSGAAQSSGIGYNPEDHGTHFGKLRARWPHYSGRAARHCVGFIDGGVLSDVVKRHFIITNMKFSANQNQAEIEVKDILHLADNKKAVAPKADTGALLEDIAIDSGVEFTLTPENVGATYPESGRASIGSEIVEYTRVDDVVTLTKRGVNKTDASTHSEGDSFQTTFSRVNARVDDVIYDMLVDYAGVNPDFIPTTKWNDEVTRWASNLRITVDILKPTGVNKLIGELAVLGLSVWWDSDLQEIGLKVNRPPDEDTIYEVSDSRNIRSISLDDNDDDRLTQVGFYSVIVNPTGSATDGNNYSRLRQMVDVDAQSENEFNDVRIKEVYTRWLGEGNQGLVRILGKRLLNRFRWSPSKYTFTIKADQDIKLTDVIRVNSRIAQDTLGRPINKLMQAISITRTNAKDEMKIMAQVYQFDQRYGFITENTRLSYTASTDAQRARGVYFCDNTTLEMSNGDPAYQLI